MVLLHDLAARAPWAQRQPSAGLTANAATGLAISEISKSAIIAGPVPLPLESSLTPNHEDHPPPTLHQPCAFRAVSRELDRSQIPSLPIRAPSKRALNRCVCHFSEGLKKDSPGPH